MVHDLHFPVIVVRRWVDLGHGFRVPKIKRPLDNVLRSGYFSQSVHCKFLNQIGTRDMISVSHLWVEAGISVTTGPVHIYVLTPQKLNTVCVTLEDVVLVNQPN